MALFVIATQSTAHALRPFESGREVFRVFQFFQLGVLVLATFFRSSPTTAKGLSELLAAALVLVPLVAYLAADTAPDWPGVP